MNTCKFTHKGRGMGGRDNEFVCCFVQRNTAVRGRSTRLYFWLPPTKLEDRETVNVRYFPLPMGRDKRNIGNTACQICAGLAMCDSDVAPIQFPSQTGPFTRRAISPGPLNP